MGISWLMKFALNRIKLPLISLQLVQILLLEIIPNDAVVVVALPSISPAEAIFQTTVVPKIIEAGGMAEIRPYLPTFLARCAKFATNRVM
jgi:hypothetical protein